MMTENSTYQSDSDDNTTYDPVTLWNESDIFKRRCSDVFDCNSNRKPLLVVMSAGNNALHSLFNQSPFTDKPRNGNANKLFAPNTNDWRMEVSRRAHFLACENKGKDHIIFKNTKGTAPRPAGWKISHCKDWLSNADHCINDEQDDNFLRTQIAALSKIVSESNNGDGISGDLWQKSGLANLTAGCRIVHCLVSSTVRHAFLTRLIVMSRAEKDAIGTDEERPDCYQQMADLYNNKEYHPHSLILPSDDFGPFFVESHPLIPFEKNMTIDRAQFKRTYFYFMKEAKIVKSKWEASGNGAEMPAIHLFEDLSSDSNSEASVFDRKYDDIDTTTAVMINKSKTGIDGEIAYSKQSMVVLRSDTIDFHELEQSHMEFRTKYKESNDNDDGEKKTKARTGMGDGKKFDFLSMHPPVALYLWFMLEYCGIWEASAAMIPPDIAMSSSHVPSILNNSNPSSPSRKHDFSVILKNSDDKHMQQMQFLQSLQDQQERHNAIFTLQSQENTFRLERQAAQDRRMELQRILDEWEVKCMLASGEDNQTAITTIIDRRKHDINELDKEIEHMHKDIAATHEKIKELQEEAATPTHSNKRRKY